MGRNVIEFSAVIIEICTIRSEKLVCPMLFMCVCLFGELLVACSPAAGTFVSAKDALLDLLGMHVFMFFQLVHACIVFFNMFSFVLGFVGHACFSTCAHRCLFSATG